MSKTIIKRKGSFKIDKNSESSFAEEISCFFVDQGKLLVSLRVVFPKVGDHCVSHGLIFVC